LSSVGLASRLFDLPSGGEVCFVHVVVFIGSRAMDPFLEDSSAYRISYTSSAFLKEHCLTHWRQTSPPASGLHRFPLHNSAIPEHAPTRLRDWVIRFSPSEGSNRDPRGLGRRSISAELTDQPLLFVHEPTFTVLRIGSIARVF